jgi:hypothetical protein
MWLIILLRGNENHRARIFSAQSGVTGAHDPSIFLAQAQPPLTRRLARRSCGRCALLR